MKKLIALLVSVLFAMTLMVAACAKKEEPAKPASQRRRPKR